MMGDNNAFIENDRGEVVIFHEGRMIPVPSDHPRNAKIRHALYEADYGAAVEMADRHQEVRRLFEAAGLGLALQETSDGVVTLNDQPLTQGLGKLAIAMLDHGAPKKPMLRFLQRASKNPREDIQEELLSFLANNDFLVDDDGYIIAWKKVLLDQDHVPRDLHSRSLDYTPGRVVTMPEEFVNDDPSVHCAPGLHFATWGFTCSFGGWTRDRTVVEMRVDPKDVRAVPHDGYTKGRATTLYLVRTIDNWEDYPKEQPPAPEGSFDPSDFAQVNHAPQTH